MTGTLNPNISESKTLNPEVKVSRLLDNFESYSKKDGIYVYGYITLVGDELLLLGDLNDRNIGNALADESVKVLYDESVFKLDESCLNKQVRIVTNTLSKEQSVLVPGYRFTLNAFLVSSLESEGGKVNAKKCFIKIKEN